MSVPQWLEEEQKSLIAAAAFGFDADGARDGIWYGGGPYYVTQGQYKVMPRIMASARQFYSGTGALGSIVSGSASGTILTVNSVLAGTAAPAIGNQVQGVGTYAIATIVSLASGTLGAAGSTYNLSAPLTIPSGTNNISCCDGQAAFFYVDTNPPGDPWSLAAMGPSSWGTLAGTAIGQFVKLRSYLDQAVATKGICIISTHGDWGVAVTAQALTMLCAYAYTLVQAGSLDVKTMLQLRKASGL
jgi:hypothetical protein